MTRYEMIESAPASRGKTLLLKHLDGSRLTARQAVIAKCCDCMGYHADGRVDCQMPSCSLYPFMPYKKNTPILPVKHNHRHDGDTKIKKTSKGRGSKNGV